MITLQASVATEHAAKYLVQLSKHWSHKIPDLTYSQERADIPLSRGPCVLEAKDGRLEVTVSSDTDENAARLAEVVAEHLKRFAFREELAIEWHNCGH